ncbi:MAG TPA: hypothetical protein HPP87_09605 [Planctomycetes bacterium]|nr:hypothetical protein [Planctomycetota bacterium]
MKKIETLAVIIIVLCVLSNISPIASTFIGAKFFGDETYGKFNLSIHLMATLTRILSLLVNIAIAIWLFKIARTEKNASPCTWLLFGFFFGLVAPLLFYLLKLYETVKPEEA